MPHRKTPATRGLFWCIEAWRQFRAAPQPVFSMAMWLSLGTFLPLLNFFAVLLITVFYGGMISSLHKKSIGAAQGYGDFFNGFRSVPAFIGLFFVGLPNIVFAIFASSVLVNALGPELAQSLSQGVQPSPEALQAVLPAVMAAALKLLPIAIVMGWVIFLAVPRVILDKRQGFVALLDALRAIYSNLGAFIVFSAALLMAIAVLSVLMAIPFALLNTAGALAGVLRTFILIFVSTFGWALYLNAMYIAWRDIFMTDTASAPSEPDSRKKEEAHIEV
jgi:hypothetical protein